VANRVAGDSGADAEARALVKLVREAEDGDIKALAQLRELADTRLPDLWETFGNVATNAERSLIDLASGKNALQKEAMGHKLANLRAELAGPNPTPLERLLVERVVLCWLQANYEDVIDAQTLKHSTSWTQTLNRQRRAEVAQRRFLSAVKALAAVRRLALPALQVNVAQQQVVANLGTATAPDPE
jgi:hypothetical protein